MDTNLEAQVQAMIAQALDRERAANAAIAEQTKERSEDREEQQNKVQIDMQRRSIFWVLDGVYLSTCIYTLYNKSI